MKRVWLSVRAFLAISLAITFEVMTLLGKVDVGVLKDIMLLVFGFYFGQATADVIKTAFNKKDDEV